MDLADKLQIGFYILLFLLCVGLALHNTSSERSLSRVHTQPVHTQPELCFFGVTPSRKACEPFGGYHRVWWETVCQPDPTCTKLPDGKDYTKP